jgi:outer membrane lipoprotein-sorting protein
MRPLYLTLCLALVAPWAPLAPCAPLAPLAPLAPCAPLAPLAPLSAAEIARRVEDRDTGRDSRAELRMKLFDRRGRVRDRALTLVTLRGRGNPGAAATAPDGDRLLMRFTYPSDIRGTGFLVWEHPKGDDERFLYLPSLGRVRRIAGTEAQESFVGSDFTYEDIGGREFDDYTYAFAGADSGQAVWTPAGGGGPREAWRLESKRKDAAAEFPRVVSLVLKDSYVVVGADVYNRRNEKQKVYTVRRLEQIEGVWTVVDSEMTNALEKTRTELRVESADYNVGMKEADFSRRELERGAIK